MGIFGGNLYGTDSSLNNGWNGLFQMGSGGLPTAPVSTNSKLLNLSSPWTFVFQNASSVYVADDSNVTHANIYHALKVAQRRFATDTISLTRPRPSTPSRAAT